MSETCLSGADFLYLKSVFDYLCVLGRRLMAMTGWGWQVTQRENVMATPKQTLQIILSPQQTQTTLQNASTKLWRGCRPGKQSSNAETHMPENICAQSVFLISVLMNDSQSHSWASMQNHRGLIILTRSQTSLSLRMRVHRSSTSFVQDGSNSLKRTE